MDILITSSSFNAEWSYREPTTVTGSSSLSVTHNLGFPPLVMFVHSDGTTEYLEVIHAPDFLSFTYNTAEALTGTMYLL